MTIFGTETPIRNGKFEQDEISFTRVRERDGQTMTSRFSGKLMGDTIKGKIEIEREGQTRSQEWSAKCGGGTGILMYTAFSRRLVLCSNVHEPFGIDTSDHRTLDLTPPSVPES